MFRFLGRASREERYAKRAATMSDQDTREAYAAIAPRLHILHDITKEFAYFTDPTYPRHYLVNYRLRNSDDEDKLLDDEREAYRLLRKTSAWVGALEKEIIERDITLGDLEEPPAPISRRGLDLTPYNNWDATQ